jgi:tetratricopeptide (TPR) repeat protein
VKNIQIQKISEFLESGKIDKAKEMLENSRQEDSTIYWMFKARIEQKLQNWGDALNAYSKVLELDIYNEEAKNNIHIIQNILNFWSPDMFNP